MKSILSLALFMIIISLSGYAQQTCPGVPSIKYQGKLYHTVRIGSQCWLKENLNVGVMIDSSKDQSDNKVIEKYCYRNDPVNCTKYGGLYQWNEALQYSSGTSKIKGICPPGWHLPDTSGISKLSAAVNRNSRELKAVGQGDGPGLGSDKSGFSALLAGSRGLNGEFFGLNSYTYFWTGTITNAVDSYDLYLNHGTENIYKSDSRVWYGLSVRCIKD
jgi:uncharacterized protein (TIGR02145 family)